VLGSGGDIRFSTKSGTIAGRRELASGPIPDPYIGANGGGLGSLDHLVRGYQKVRRDFETESARRSQVNDQVELRRLHNR